MVLSHKLRVLDAPSVLAQTERACFVWTFDAVRPSINENDNINIMSPKPDSYPSPTKPAAPLVMPVTLMAYSSQYTRPVDKVLKEVLDRDDSKQ